MITRRKLLLSTTSMALMAKTPIAAASSSAAEIANTAYQRQIRFRRALKKHPWLIGLGTPDKHTLRQDKLNIEGKIPDNLQGDFIRNGPARHDIGNFRYSHIFDGDGMIQRFRIKDAKVSHLGRYVQTEKYLAEKKAAKSIKNTFGTLAQHPQGSQLPAAINAANINVMFHHKKLLALWEQDAPYHIDLDTLETYGKEISVDEHPYLPFTAHPKVDARGRLYSFGYNLIPREFLMIYEKDIHGKMLRFEHIAIDKLAPVHDFALSENYIIIPIPPVYITDQGESFGERLDFDSKMETRVLVVDRRDFKQRRWYSLPPQWVFHHASCFEDSDGVLHLYSCRYDNADIMLKSFFDIMSGEESAIKHLGSSYFYHTRFYPDGRVVDQNMDAAIGANVEFPRIFGHEAHNNLTLMLLRTREDNSITHPFFNGVGIWDVSKSRLMQSYHYGDSEIAEEHCFVPNPDKPNDEKSAYIIGTTLDSVNQQTVLNFFHASSLSRGPVARARLSYALPLGFHGNFVASV